MSILGSRVRTAVPVAVVTALFTGGIAWAVSSSPIDNAGTIHACYNPKDGAVRLNVAGACPKSGQSTPITWNVAGPPGSQGVPGPQGERGQGLGAIHLAMTFTLTSNGCAPGSVRLVEQRHLVGPAVAWEVDSALDPQYQGAECQAVSYAVQQGTLGSTRYLTSASTEALPPLAANASNPSPMFNAKYETGQPHLDCTAWLVQREVFTDHSRRLGILCALSTGGLSTAALAAAIDAGIESDPWILRLLPSDYPS